MPKKIIDSLQHSSYLALPAALYQVSKPVPVKKTSLLLFNQPLATAFNLATVPDDKTIEILAGNAIVKNTSPLTLAYAGHQFGQFVPQLGDGRGQLAFLEAGMADRH